MAEEWSEEHIAELKTMYKAAENVDWLRHVGLCSLNEIDRLRDQLTDARSDRNSEVAQLRADLRIARNSWNFDEGKKIITERDVLRVENERLRGELDYRASLRKPSEERDNVRLCRRLADMYAHIEEAVDVLWQMRMNSKQAANVLVKLRRWGYEPGREEEPKVNFKHHDIDDL